MNGNDRIAPERLVHLRRVAIRMRRLVVESVHRAGAGHLGGPLSAAEILTALYFEVMRIDPERPRDPDRDRFILSKGHCSIGCPSKGNVIPAPDGQLRVTDKTCIRITSRVAIEQFFGPPCGASEKESHPKATWRLRYDPVLVAKSSSILLNPGRKGDRLIVRS